MAAQVCFPIKICGMRSLQDVRMAGEAGADAVGLNFYPPSIRYLDPADVVTSDLSDFARDLGLTPVAVFVNEPPSQVLQIAKSLGLTAVQLHGDESIEDAKALLAAGVGVLRAVRLPLGELTVEGVQERVGPWQEAGCSILLDADGGADYGGQGQRLDWETLGRWSAEVKHPWMLAGGLTSETVATAIALARPSGVDVASGVERPRGSKCAQMISDFCRASRQ